MSIELSLLRIDRNNLLKDSDWTVLPDSPLSDSKKDEWKIYRQALRDITKTAKPKLSENSPFLDPSSVTFPTKPS
tara:strand:- start:656 stop:880 length:225 start_codon:yes stop_codon:yes gene_type:complete